MQKYIPCKPLFACFCFMCYNNLKKQTIFEKVVDNL